MFLPKVYRNSRVLRYLCVFAWATIIFFFSSQPTLPGPSIFVWDFAFKKLAHICVYFILYYLTYQAISFDDKKMSRASLSSFVFSLVYAISDEVHQSFIPGRTATGKDVFYDILGMLIAWLAIFKYI